jgi:hypothetical protein
VMPEVFEEHARMRDDADPDSHDTWRR